MIETFVVGRMATNCYLVNGVIIDPGDDPEYISAHLSDRPSLIIATHGHFDHIMGAYALQLMYNIPFAIHEKDAFLLKNMQKSAMHFLGLSTVDPPPASTRFVGDGETVAGLKIIHTPGHTPGSISLACGDSLFTGDTLFADGAVGRTDFSYGEPLRLAESIARINAFPRGTRALPGHGKPFMIGI